jgi:macrolide-specific efflux system membrane fusion protein
MTANVKFFIQSRSDILVIPTAAIHQEKGKSFVWVPDPTDPQYPMSQEVQTGLSDGKKTELLSGLSEGETILIPNLAKLRSKEGGGTNPFSPFGRRRAPKKK